MSSRKPMFKNQRFLNWVRKEIGKNICLVLINDEDFLMLNAENVVFEIQTQTLLGQRLYRFFTNHPFGKVR